VKIAIGRRPAKVACRSLAVRSHSVMVRSIQPDGGTTMGQVLRSRPVGKRVWWS
jgi:hypothetical protein